MMIRTTLLPLTTAVLIAGPGGAQTAGEQTLAETGPKVASFSTLLEAAGASGLTETLQGEGPYTVFAPTDEAFAQLPDGTLDSLMNDQEQLIEVLTYHVVPGRLMSSDLESGIEVDTAEGSTVTITNGDGVQVNDARVIRADVEASNGVVHVVDGVLMPDGAM